MIPKHSPLCTWTNRVTLVQCHRTLAHNDLFTYHQSYLEHILLSSDLVLTTTGNLNPLHADDTNWRTVKIFNAAILRAHADPSFMRRETKYPLCMTSEMFTTQVVVFIGCKDGISWKGDQDGDRLKKNPWKRKELYAWFSRHLMMSIIIIMPWHSHTLPLHLSSWAGRSN